MAARRGIDLEADALPATLAYRALLQRLDAAPFDAAVTALWVLERVYLLGWASAASSTSPFGEFVEHWTDPGFAGYVDGLGELATLDGHDDQVADVLTHEVAFWDMALA
jgi:thiaminase/transcriptional activator TenA